MLTRYRFAVRSHEIYPDYRLKPYHFLSYFQDAVSQFFAGYGRASFDLQREGKSWIITRLRMELLNPMPVWRDEVTLEIWVRKKEGFRLSIDFRVLDEGDVLIGRGTSIWGVIDEAMRRPRPLKGNADIIPVNPHEALPGFSFRKLPVIEGKPLVIEQPVRSYDVDFNNHLNNVRYLAAGVEAIPLDYRNRHVLKDAEIDFIEEARYGEMIRVESVPSLDNNGTFFHRLLQAESGHEFCRMITTWEEKPVL